MVIIVSCHSSVCISSLLLFVLLIQCWLLGSVEWIAVKINWNIFHIQKEWGKKERSERTSWGWLIFSLAISSSLSSSRTPRVPEIIEEQFFWVPWLMAFLSSFELRSAQRGRDWGRIKTETTRTHLISIRVFCFCFRFAVLGFFDA